MNNKKLGTLYVTVELKTETGESFMESREVVIDDNFYLFEIAMNLASEAGDSLDQRTEQLFSDFFPEFQ